MARRTDVRGTASGRRIATIACLTALAGVALIGMLHPLSAAGGGQPAATAALAASSAATWGGDDPMGGLNWIDLITKGAVVLGLLFITLRILGRVGTGTKKRGHRLEVLESRPLAAKASLHLVAIGDRRLVVGLTPAGMVSLAELDASELESDALAAAAEDPESTGSEAGSSGQMRPATLGSALNSLLAPLDALTGRMAALLNGGRVR